MKFPQHVRRWLFGLALCTGALWTSGIGAKEPVQQFLDGLRKRGYFDTAQKYLESLRTNPLVDAATKELIPYEQGQIVVEISKNEAVTKERLKLLDQAREWFNEFLEKSPEHEFVGMARIQLGNLLIERGRAMVNQARKPKNADQKDAILANARKEFKEAQTVLEKAVKEFDAAVKEFLTFVPKEQKELRRKKNAVRRDVIQARFNLGNAIYQHGLSYEIEDSKERKQLMTDAAKAFKKIYIDYRRVLAGLIAGMWEGRSYQQMGDLRRALGLYSELLNLPDGDQPFRDLKAKVLRLAMEAWNDPRQNKLFESEKRGEVWLQKAKPGEDDSPAGLAIQYLLAQAKHLILLADKKTSPKPKKKGKKDPKFPGKLTSPQRRRLESEIVKLLLKVSIARNEFRQSAKKLLAIYRDIKQGEPVNFAEAYDQGQMKLQAWQDLLDKGVRGIEPMQQAKHDQDEKLALDDTIRLFRLALELKEGEENAQSANLGNVRYYLTFLYFKKKMYWNAAIQGEFLAQHYPQLSISRQAAWISLAAWVALYNDVVAVDGKKPFETTQLVRMAELIASKWPTTKIADDAWMMLGDIKIREGDLKKATEYLEKVPADSERRPDADLKLGQALWGLYLKERNRYEKERSNEPPPSKVELDQMLKELNKLLSESKARLQSGADAKRKSLGDVSEITSALLAGELSLAQIAINETNAAGAANAIKILTDENHLATLYEAGHKVAKHGRFAQEAYKVLLRSYILTGQVQEALGILEKLKTLTKNQGAEAQKMLSQLYVSLGQDIKEQLRSAVPARKAVLVKAFDEFLDRILQDPKLGYDSLLWVAATYVGLGDGLGKSPDAKRYFDQAISSYERMKTIKKAERELEKDAEKLKKIDAILTGIDTRLATCYQGMGQHEKAVNIYLGILFKNENLLEVQREACHAFTAMAKAANNPKDISENFRHARAGWKFKGKQLVWGWALMSRRLQRYVKKPQGTLREMFFESRLEFSKSFYDHAMKISGEEQTKLLKKGYDSIDLLYRLYKKDINNDADLRKSFNSLLIKIQTAQGKSASGLRGLVAHAVGDRPLKVRETTAVSAQAPKSLPQEAIGSGVVAPSSKSARPRESNPLWRQPAVIAGVFGGLVGLVMIIYLARRKTARGKTARGLR